MALTEDTDDREESKESAKTAFDPISEPVVLAAAASVALSWYLFFIKEDKVHGLFVGLWAPTLTGAASYLKQLRVLKKLEGSLSFE